MDNYAIILCNLLCGLRKCEMFRSIESKKALNDLNGVAGYYQLIKTIGVTFDAF